MRLAVAAMFLMLLWGCGTAPPPPEPPQPAEWSALAPEAASAVRAALDHVKVGSDEPKSWLQLARLYHAHGLEPLAIPCYEVAIDLGAGGDQARAWHLLGIALARGGEYERALAASDHAANEASYAPACWRAGFWLLDLGRPDDAATQFEQAMSINPTDTAAMIGLARARMQQQRLTEAAAVLEGIRNRGGNHPYLTYLLGTVYQRMGRDADALLRRGNASPPTWNDPWYHEVLAERRGYEADLSRAMAKFDAGDLAGAVRSLQAMRKARPRDATILNNLGAALHGSGDAEGAIEVLHASIRFNPSHAPSHITLAGVWLAEGSLDRASAFAEKAIELQPAMAPAREQAGRIAMASGRMEDAAGHLQAAVQIGSIDPSVRELLGIALLDLNENSDALQHFEITLRTDPDRPASIGGMAMAMARLGRRAEALQILAAAQQRFPGHPALSQAASLIGGGQ